MRLMPATPERAGARLRDLIPIAMFTADTGRRTDTVDLIRAPPRPAARWPAPGRAQPSEAISSLGGLRRPV
jgi:hypothetical protein